MADTGTKEHGHKHHHHKHKKMPLKVILMRNGLEEYYQFFEKANLKEFDPLEHLSDQEVERYIGEVELKVGIEFLPAVRARIWKALRYQWFRGPRSKEFKYRLDIDKVLLPKRSYRLVDSMMKFGELDSDRQRQITRKVKPVAPTGRGPAIATSQFEVYTRQADVFYEFLDMQRCVAEWQRKNPRTLLREDPREEVIKMRIRGVMDKVAMALAKRRVTEQKHHRVFIILIIIRLIMGGMAVFMFFVAYLRFMSGPQQLLLQFMGGSKQFVSAASFLLAAAVAYVVALRRRTDPMLDRLQKTMISAERLIQQLQDFRIETEEVRMVTQHVHDVSLDNNRRQDKRKAIDASAHKRKSRKPKEHHLNEGLALWCPNYKEGLPDLKQLQRQLEDSHRIVEALPDEHRRPGGDRMIAHKDKLPFLTDEDLVVTHHAILKAEQDPTALPALPADLTELAQSRSASHLSGGRAVSHLSLGSGHSSQKARGGTKEGGLRQSHSSKELQPGLGRRNSSGSLSRRGSTTSQGRPRMSRRNSTSSDAGRGRETHQSRDSHDGNDSGSPQRRSSHESGSGSPIRRSSTHERRTSHESAGAGASGSRRASHET